MIGQCVHEIATSIDILCKNALQLWCWSKYTLFKLEEPQMIAIMVLEERCVEGSYAIHL